MGHDPHLPAPHGTAGTPFPTLSEAFCFVGHGVSAVPSFIWAMGPKDRYIATDRRF
jgi:hypothetical protein